MDPKNMTLGELVCEFVEFCMGYAEYMAVRSAEGNIKKKDKRMCELRETLLLRLNLLESSIPREKLKWGIPNEMRNAIRGKSKLSGEKFEETVGKK